MITRNEQTVFENALIEGEVQIHEDHWVWVCHWIGDAGEDEHENHDVVYDAICEAREIIENLGYSTGESYAEHDYATFEFWRK